MHACIASRSVRRGTYRMEHVWHLRRTWREEPAMKNLL
jgi:hypothetical protein